jgi:hypothetical protein
VIAGIAAWVSYWHMKDVAHTYGEATISAYLLPISVDGLIVVASVSLVELAGRIRMLEDAQSKTNTVAGSPAVAPVQFVQPAPVFQAPPAPVAAAPVPTPVHSIAASAVDDETELDGDFEDEELERLSAGGLAHGTASPRSAPVSPAVGPIYVNGSSSGARPAATRAAVSTPARTMVTESTTPKRRPASETAQLADAIEAMQPDIGEGELAARLNVSVSRLRQVRREAEAKRASLRS